MPQKEKRSSKRPKLVWVICIFYFVSAGWTLLSFFLMFTGRFSPSPAIIQYYENLSIFDYAVSILMMIFNTFGAITLFILRKIAVYSFVASFGVYTISIGITVYNKLFLNAVRGTGVISLFIAYGILAVICIYTMTLKERGILS